MSGMSKRDQIAAKWHLNSDHGRDGTPFGGPLCNCLDVAGRIMPMLREAWRDGAFHGWRNGDEALTTAVYDHNPYEAEGDR